MKRKISLYKFAHMFPLKNDGQLKNKNKKRGKQLTRKKKKDNHPSLTNNKKNHAQKMIKVNK